MILMKKMNYLLEVLFVNDSEILNASINIYKKFLYPKIYDLIEKYKNIEIGDKYL